MLVLPQLKLHDKLAYIYWSHTQYISHEAITNPVGLGAVLTIHGIGGLELLPSC